MTGFVARGVKLAWKQKFDGLKRKICNSLKSETFKKSGKILCARSQVKFAFILNHRNEFTLLGMWRVLHVSRAGFYAWKARSTCRQEQRRETLTEAISKAHGKAKRRYGAPRVWQRLQRESVVCGRNLVAKLMRENGLVGFYKRRGRKPGTMNITVQSSNFSGNLLKRQFSPRLINQAWVADFIYLPTSSDWLFLAVVLDLFLRRVVGWSLFTHADENLVTKALQMALEDRRPAAGLLHHCDPGSLYRAVKYGQTLAAHGLTSSMSRKGNCHDNAVVKRFFGKSKREMRIE